MKGSKCKVCGHEHWLREPHILPKNAPAEIRSNRKTNQREKESTTPEGTKVDTVYKALRMKGKTAGPAARIAQAVTGEALATGKPPKGKKATKKK